jgi:hypothetical protein
MQREAVPTLNRAGGKMVKKEGKKGDVTTTYSAEK